MILYFILNDETVYHSTIKFRQTHELYSLGYRVKRTAEIKKNKKKKQLAAVSVLLIIGEFCCIYSDTLLSITQKVLHV